VSPPRIALLTEPALPALSPDDQPLRAALEADGWRVLPAQWRGPVADADLAIVRSCWDYAPHASAFLAACDAWAADRPLVNPPATLRWNIDKRYLLELARLGIPMPETVVVPGDSERSLAEVMAELGAASVVIKPCIGASGIGAWRGDGPGDGRWASSRGTDRLVQRYVPEVTADGELSLVYFRDGFSHAVLKRAAAGEFRVQEEHGGTVVAVAVPGAVREAADRVLAAVERDWWYARVDGVVSGGRFLLMELELIEPELFFRLGPGSAARFTALLRGAR
jgi:glutathione synthase/RimK-type ligase-like ATP-grasp enzyme